MTKEATIGEALRLASLLNDLPEREASYLLPLFLAMLNDEIPTGYSITLEDLIEALEKHLGYPARK